MDAATKEALLGLLDEAGASGWSFAGACRELELGEMRAYRWRERRDSGNLADHAPGGHPMHGLLEDEVQAIIDLYHDWGEVDRSHRKLAHRGSYTNTVWVAPSSVRRVLAAHGLVLHPPKRPGSSARKPFPDWVEYRPNQIWVYDTTHFTRARAAVTIVEDLVSRTTALLSEHRAMVEEQLKEAGGTLADDSFVFSPFVEHTTPFRPDNVTGFFTRVRDAVGAPHVRLHDLRHFTATQLISAGVDIRTVAERLGHSDPSLTLRVYAHVIEARDRAAADIMGKVLTPKVKKEPALAST